MIATYLRVCTNDAILSLMSSITTLFASSKSSLDIVLLLNWMIFDSLKGNNTGHYVQLTICSCWYTPHMHIVYVVLHSLYDPIWGIVEDDHFFPALSLHRVSCEAHKIENTVNLDVSHNIFIDVCDASFMPFP